MMQHIEAVGGGVFADVMVYISRNHHLLNRRLDVCFISCQSRRFFD
jgi:hypothetical protein